MITSALMHYVRARLAAGTPEDEIRDTLLRRGWEERDIEEALRLAAPRAEAVTLPTHTPSAGKKVTLSAALIIVSMMYTIWTYVYGQPADLSSNFPVDTATSTLTDASIPRRRHDDSASMPQVQPSQPAQPTNTQTTASQNTSSGPSGSASNQTTSASAPTQTTSAPSPAPTQTTTQTPTQSTPTPTPAPAPKPAGQYADGTYKGSVANAFYGYVQVAAVINNGQLENVQILRYPNDRGTSRYINSIAMPALQKEAIQAQSANVHIVSGATDSSMAFRESLGSALALAKN